MTLKIMGVSTQSCFPLLATANASDTCPVVSDARYHPVVKLAHDVRKPLRTTEFLHDVPQSVTIPRVKGFRLIHEGSVDVGSHLLALLLWLVSGDGHIGCSAVSLEHTVAFREQILL
ncbi:unnamed protein product [Schistocephalus solidus]|uniref:Uncharacterized protein n=1 Tax=Schistocephalus solidus TaxID=70667 RepID=A0A183T5Z8_SCHSO|nr:unnamed protein product [Schistocephalus solidus]